MLTTRNKNSPNFSAGRIPTFLTGVFLAAYGRAAFYLGAAWILVEEGHGATTVASFFALVSAAELVVSPGAGWATDRWSRRWLSACADIARTAISAVVVCIPADDKRVVIFAAAIAFVCAERLALTASHAMIPEILASMPLAKANSFVFFSMQCGNLLAAVLGGYVLSVYGFSAFFVAIAAAFFLSAAAMVSVRTNPSVKRPTYVDQLSSMKADTRVIDLIAIYALLCGCSTMVSAMTASLVFDELLGGAFMFGLLEGAWFFGSILGALLMIPLGRSIGPSHLTITILVAAATAMITTKFVAVPVLFVLFGLLGLFYNLGRVNVEMRLQLAVVNSRLGRAKGWMHACGMALSLVVLGALATVGNTVKPSTTFSVFGLVVAVSVATLAVRARGSK